MKTDDAHRFYHVNKFHSPNIRLFEMYIRKSRDWYSEDLYYWNRIGPDWNIQPIMFKYFSSLQNTTPPSTSANSLINETIAVIHAKHYQTLLPHSGPFIVAKSLTFPKLYIFKNINWKRAAMEVKMHGDGTKHARNVNISAFINSENNPKLQMNRIQISGYSIPRSDRVCSETCRVFWGSSREPFVVYPSINWCHIVTYI